MQPFSTSPMNDQEADEGSLHDWRRVCLGQSDIMANQIQNANDERGDSDNIFDQIQFPTSGLEDPGPVGFELGQRWTQAIDDPISYDDSTLPNVLAQWAKFDLAAHDFGAMIAGPSDVPTEHFEPAQSTHDTFMPDSLPEIPLSQEPDLEVVCYGMLHQLDVQTRGAAANIVSILGRSQARRSQFELKCTHDQRIIIHFPGGADELGYLRSHEGEAICGVLSDGHVEAHAIGIGADIQETLSKAKTSNDARVRIDIIVCGPRGRAAGVGGKLSKAKLWLQQPDDDVLTRPYENPHLLGLKIEDLRPETVLTNDRMPRADILSKATVEKRLQELVKRMYQSVSNGRHLDKEDAGTRVIKSLLEHQQEALAFMLERESGHINPRYQLWKEITHDSITEYQHRITKTKRRVRPEEKGGGILADEMGMGKTLSILALTMRTLDHARVWASEMNSQKEQVLEQSKARLHSRATLVIVSSLLLINNWKREIEESLEPGLDIVIYHGPRRPNSLDRLSDSDIVITTYNTLATEFQKIPKTSPLHQMEWFRVVLDEAHIIRRPSTIYFRSCAELIARSRWCLTGTPIQNKLSDIGALISFIRADPFHHPAVFRRWIEAPFYNAIGDLTRVTQRLIALVEALCLRRTRELLRLKPLRQSWRGIRLTPEERQRYDNTRATLMRTIQQRVGQDKSVSTFGLFQANLQLRILCNHGTFQRPFSWHRANVSQQDQDQALGYALGAAAEFLCSACGQPMPVLTSSIFNDRIGQRCIHVLCEECTEQSQVPGKASRHGECPLCAIFAPNEVDEPMPTMPASDNMRPGSNTAGFSNTRALGEYNHDNYFNASGHSTKMVRLMKDVSKDLWTTKSIIFSCWTRTLDLISIYLEHGHIPFLRIDGNTPARERQRQLDSFARGTEQPVLIMTTGIGAFGLNLTCANRVFITELQWNPSVENQAIARAIRLGQERQVHVVRYVVRDTVEEDMRSQQRGKKEIAAMGFEEELEEEQGMIDDDSIMTSY